MTFPNTLPWPHDNTAAKMAFYGDFREKTWASTHLVKMSLPYPLYYGQTKLTGIIVHMKVAASLNRIFKAILANLGPDGVSVKHADQYSGCFNIRKIAGSDNWSNHSWACAIDLDGAHNGFNTGHGTMHSIVIKAFKDEGWRWGGDYLHRTDPMHFEAVQP